MDITEQLRLTTSHALLVFEIAIKALLLSITTIILITMSGVVFKVTILLYHLWGGTVHEITKMVIVNVLMTLALLEVLRTTLVYFSEGRVKITYIIDTCLVGVLTEVMAFWFQDVNYQKLLIVIALVLTLVVARIVTIRYSPALGRKKGSIGGGGKVIQKYAS